METIPNRKKKIGAARLILGNIAILGLLLIVVEGLASYGLLVRNVLNTVALAERQHTIYDPELGWVNKPNAHIPDMYGPGIYFKTNAQGFRGDRDISAAVPEGKTRVVCSGDSFTLGFGVDDDHTWCRLLSLLEPRLETVNMGQGGYGVDQAYLWYKRDGGKIEHQLHLLAFITHDFHRMQFNSFGGYAKPMLEVENGALAVKNVPVPRQNDHRPWFPRHIEKLRQLRTVELLTRLAWKIRPATAVSRRIAQTEKDDKTREVLHKLFEDLKKINEQRSSQLVLVYLPTIDELRGGGPLEWTEFLEAQSRILGIPFINLFDEFRALSDDEIGSLFILRGQLSYQHAEGHLMVAGNEFVAKALRGKLMSHPAISRILSARLR